MILAAIVIGVITAYYFGLRLGGYAAAASGGLFLLAAVWPTKALLLYGLTAVGFLGVLVVGPRRQTPGAKADLLRLFGRVLGWTRRRFK